MANDEIKADLSRFRTYIQQGKLRKIKHLFSSQPERLAEFLGEEFDACAYATRFKQKAALTLLHDYGEHLHPHPSPHILIVYCQAFLWMAIDTRAPSLL